MVDDWLEHTPKEVIAKNFGVNISVINNLPTSDPYILNGTISNGTVKTGSGGTLSGASSFGYHTLQHAPENVPGNKNNNKKNKTTKNPNTKTKTTTNMTLKPGALRELHWHPN